MENAIAELIDRINQFALHPDVSDAELARNVRPILEDCRGFLLRSATAGSNEIIEKCAKVCEAWPLSAENMNLVADRHGDWSAKLAGVCRADLPRAIRALKNAAPQEQVSATQSSAPDAAKYVKEML